MPPLLPQPCLYLLSPVFHKTAKYFYGQQYGSLFIIRYTSGSESKSSKVASFLLMLLQNVMGIMLSEFLCEHEGIMLYEILLLLERKASLKSLGFLITSLFKRITGNIILSILVVLYVTLRIRDKNRIWIVSFSERIYYNYIEANYH